MRLYLAFGMAFGMAFAIKYNHTLLGGSVQRPGPRRRRRLAQSCAGGARGAQGMRRRGAGNAQGIRRRGAGNAQGMRRRGGGNAQGMRRRGAGMPFSCKASAHTYTSTKKRLCKLFFSPNLTRTKRHNTICW